MMRATSFDEHEVYRPDERPGYVAWLSLFPFDDVRTERVDEIIRFLADAGILVPEAQGRWHWLRSVHCGAEAIHGARICDVKEHYV